MKTTYKPIHVIRCGNVKASCWLNLCESGSFYSTRIVRVYYDKSTEQWGQSDAFSDARDLVTVAYVAHEMCRWISMQKETNILEEETLPEPPGPDA